MKNYKEIMEAAKKNPLFNKYAEETRVKMAIADQIFYARKRGGLDQGELARLAGTSQRIISNIESGQYDPGSCLLSRITKALNLPHKLGNTNLGGGNPVWLWDNDNSANKIVNVLSSTAMKMEWSMEKSGSKATNYLSVIRSA